GVDRNARFADVADDARVVAVIATVGGEVERDRNALLTGSQRLAVEGVRLLRSREAGILADGPWPAGIHGRARPAHERLQARQRVEVTDALQVVGGVERLDRNAFRRVPH